MDIKRIIGATEKNELPFRMSVDDIDSHKLTKVLGYLDTHKSGTKNVDPQQLGCEEQSLEQGNSGLRRSNSEGNLSMSVADAAKEQKVRAFFGGSKYYHIRVLLRALSICA